MKRPESPPSRVSGLKFSSEYEAPWAGYSDSYATYTGAWRHQRPAIDESKCNQCGICYVFCPQGCITYIDGKFGTDLDFCKGCGICAEVCPKKAFTMIPEA